MSDEFDLSPDVLRGIPTAIAHDATGMLDLTDLAEEVDASRAPSLVDDAARMWRSSSGLHSSLLSTSIPIGSGEAWQALVQELAEESNHCDDESLRGVMLAEAGRILIERLGRQEEGELLLRRSGSPLADILRRTGEDNTSSLAAELAELEDLARDETRTNEARSVAWIEFGLLCEERTSSRVRAIQAYRAALALLPAQPIALYLATQAALLLGDKGAAAGHIRELLTLVQSSSQRVALLLELADLIDEPEEQLIVLEQAHQAEPTEEAVLRRLTRALAATGDLEQLGELYHELARVSEDPISSSTALHMAFLILADAGRPVDELVIELAERAPDRGDTTDMLAPLAEVALYVEQRIAAGDETAGLPENVAVLERLARCLDDPREQALVREQLARIRLGQLRQHLSPSASGERKLVKLDDIVTPLCDRLESGLRFCLVHLPEHRWVREALAEVLELRSNLPALVLHLQEWARSAVAGPARATILLRLGRVHEHQRNDLARAAEIYELAAAEDADNPDCLRSLGRVYELMRRWPQAVAALRRQASETEDDQEKVVALRRVAALAEQELGDVDLAIAALEDVAKIEPDDLLSLYQLATLCRTERRPAVLVTALAWLVNRVDDDVARTALLVELGEVQELVLKQRPAARTCYEQALSLTPGYMPALRALSRLYRDNGDLDDLIGLLDPTVDTVTDPAVLALKAGRACFEEVGDIDRAIGHLRRSYEIDPDLVPARELLLQLLTATGKLEEAYDLLRAYDLPRSAPLLADHHYRLGLLAEAAARQNKGNPAIEASDRLEDNALQHYRAALAHQPDHGLAFERSRRLLVAHNDTPNLVRLIEHLVITEGDEWTHVLHVQLGRLHVASGDAPNAARRAYEAAQAAAPDDPIVRREFEGLLRLLDDRKSLPGLYLRSAADTKDPHLRATMLVEAAELLLASGAIEDKEVAGRAILEALQVDPGNSYAVRHLERLLSEPDSPFVVKDAVSARAVRAQSDAERAIFYVESAELLEKVGAWGQARRAYLAAKGALPQLAPADLGLARTASENRRTAAIASGVTSIHVLVAEARSVAIRAGRGDADARTRALELITEILERDPQNRDAVALARTLAGQVGDPSPVFNLLAGTFGRLEDRELRYDLGLFLGENSVSLDDAVRYYGAAADARPNGRRALRGLVNAYRQMGDDRQAAAATERLLELFEPGEPSAIDLRMGIANFLSNSPETLPRALEHARIVLSARPDDPRAVGLLADLHEQAGHRAEASELLDRLIGRERNRERLHDIYLRKARLLADVKGHETDALDAIEHAAAISPGNRDTITLLVEQLRNAGQTARVSTYLPPIRSALVANISRGAVSLRDLKLLSAVAEPQQPVLAKVAAALLRALGPPGQGSARLGTSTLMGVRRLVDTPSLRRSLYAQGEPPHLHALLQALDGLVARLPNEFPGVADADNAPVPREVDTAPLLEYARALADVVGLRAPRLATSSGHNTVLLLADPICTIRFGQNLWTQGDETAWRGLIAIAVARSALGAARSRALSPPNMDLLVSACFEVVEVFNPTTADPDPHRLRELVANLRNVVPRRQRKTIELACQALASHPFDAGVTARTTTSTDLHFASLISGNPEGVLVASCLLDGVAGGTLKQRVGRSRLARELLGFLVSDEFVECHQVAVGG